MYVGLLNGSMEPDSSTGYMRIESDLNCTVFFPVSKGYGVITKIGLYEDKTGREPIETINLPEPVDIHEGVVPIVHSRKLLRGLDVTAKILASTSGALNT